MVLNAFLLSFDGYWAYAGFKGMSLHAIILGIVDTVAAPALSIVGQLLVKDIVKTEKLWDLI